MRHRDFSDFGGVPPLLFLLLSVIVSLMVSVGDETLAGLTLRYSPCELAKMRELFFPEERRSEFTSEPWDGVNFRHYRDPKITCIEHYLSPAKPIGAHALPKRGRKPAA